MRHLDSDLTWTGNLSKQAAVPDSLNNNLQWNRFEWIFSSQYTYKYNEWQFRIELPLNYTEGITSQISISKVIDAIASTLKFGGIYTLASSLQLAQGRILHSNRQQYTVMPEISTRISSWAGFSYHFLYIESRSKIKEQGALQPIRSSTQKIQLSIFSMKNLILNLVYEYFYNSAIVSGSRTMSFGDIGAKYKWNQIEFLLDYTNFLNSKRYISASYSEIGSNYYVYDLRPAEILLRVRFKLK